MDLFPYTVTLLHSQRPKLHRVLAVLSAIRLISLHECTGRTDLCAIRLISLHECTGRTEFSQCACLKVHAKFVILLTTQKDILNK